MTQEHKEIELWKPIPNYEEYEVSTFGRVKRLAYDKPVCGGSFQHCNERILSPQLRKNGYQTVMLSKKGVIKSFLIHRLVAITFIPNYKTCGNYQWKYSNSDKEIVDIRTWIVQFTKEGEQICTYESITQASTSTGISRTSISNNLSNKSKSAGGFIWKKVQNNYS